jgi:hypothetical protein
MDRISEIDVHKTVLDPVIIHGCESWLMNEKVKTVLNAWKTNLFGKLYGPVTEQDLWRIRTNQERGINTSIKPMIWW